METRAAIELRSIAPGRLAGYAAVYDRDSHDLGGFVESVARGAFDRSLAASENVLALLEHDRQKVLGRVGSGTLGLFSDERGLRFEIDLPQTTVGRDLGVLVERGDVSGASFAFTVPKGGEVWGSKNGVPHRELLDVSLYEITITATPAYPDTTVAKRSLFARSRPKTSQRMRLLELLCD